MSGSVASAGGMLNSSSLAASGVAGGNGSVASISGVPTLDNATTNDTSIASTSEAARNVPDVAKNSPEISRNTNDLSKNIADYSLNASDAAKHVADTAKNAIGAFGSVKNTLSKAIHGISTTIDDVWQLQEGQTVDNVSNSVLKEKDNLHNAASREIDGNFSSNENSHPPRQTYSDSPPSSSFSECQKLLSETEKSGSATVTIISKQTRDQESVLHHYNNEFVKREGVPKYQGQEPVKKDSKGCGTPEKRRLLPSAADLMGASAPEERSLLPRWFRLTKKAESDKPPPVCRRRLGSLDVDWLLPRPIRLRPFHEGKTASQKVEISDTKSDSELYFRSSTNTNSRCNAMKNRVCGDQISNSSFISALHDQKTSNNKRTDGGNEKINKLL